MDVIGREVGVRSNRTAGVGVRIKCKGHWEVNWFKEEMIWLRAV